MDQGQNNQNTVPFTQFHHEVYNNLRDTLMQAHAAGVPGIDKVVDALNKQHTTNMPNYVGQEAQQPQRQVAPPQGNELQSLNAMMSAIRQNNGAPMPNGFGGYSNG